MIVDYTFACEQLAGTLKDYSELIRSREGKGESDARPDCLLKAAAYWEAYSALHDSVRLSCLNEFLLLNEEADDFFKLHSKEFNKIAEFLQESKPYPYQDTKRSLGKGPASTSITGDISQCPFPLSRLPGYTFKSPPSTKYHGGPEKPLAERIAQIHNATKSLWDGEVNEYFRSFEKNFIEGFVLGSTLKGYNSYDNMGKSLGQNQRWDDLKALADRLGVSLPSPSESSEDSESREDRESTPPQPVADPEELLQTVREVTADQLERAGKRLGMYGSAGESGCPHTPCHHPMHQLESQRSVPGFPRTLSEQDYDRFLMALEASRIAQEGNLPPRDRFGYTPGGRQSGGFPHFRGGPSGHGYHSFHAIMDYGKDVPGIPKVFEVLKMLPKVNKLQTFDDSAPIQTSKSSRDTKSTKPTSWSNNLKLKPFEEKAQAERPEIGRSRSHSINSGLVTSWTGDRAEVTSVDMKRMICHHKAINPPTMAPVEGRALKRTGRFVRAFEGRFEVFSPNRGNSSWILEISDSMSPFYDGVEPNENPAYNKYMDRMGANLATYTNFGLGNEKDPNGVLDIPPPLAIFEHLVRTSNENETGELHEVQNLPGENTFARSQVHFNEHPRIFNTSRISVRDGNTTVSSHYEEILRPALTRLASLQDMQRPAPTRIAGILPNERPATSSVTSLRENVRPALRRAVTSLHRVSTREFPTPSYEEYSRTKNSENSPRRTRGRMSSKGSGNASPAPFV